VQAEPLALPSTLQAAAQPTSPQLQGLQGAVALLSSLQLRQGAVQPTCLRQRALAH